MAKFTYRIVENGTLIADRKTDRTYTHAVVAEAVQGGRLVIIGYCGRADLAAKLCATSAQATYRWRGNYGDGPDLTGTPVYRNVRIVPLERTAHAQKPKVRIECPVEYVVDWDCAAKGTTYRRTVLNTYRNAKGEVVLPKGSAELFLKHRREHGCTEEFTIIDMEVK